MAGATDVTSRVIEATAENARRLAECYRRHLWDDERLARAVLPAEAAEAAAIDGMVEPMDADDFASCLAANDAVAFEAIDPGNPAGPPIGFAILRYATGSPDSIRQFAEFFRGESLGGQPVTFHDGDCRARFDSALSRGNIASMVELIGGGAVTPSLFAAVVSEWHARMDGACLTLVSKVLDGVGIGGFENKVGNRRARKLTIGMGIKPIGGIQLRRPLSLPAELASELGVGADPGSKAERDGARSLQRTECEAVLKFGVYLGDTAVLGG